VPVVRQGASVSEALPPPGTLAHLVCVALRRRRYRPITVGQLTQVVKAEAPHVSNALQRLKELGLARLVDAGWVYRRQRK
jgi:hypothetical protein